MREWALLRIALPRAYIIGITEGKDKRIILGALAAGLSGILRPCSAKKHFLHAIEEATRERKFVDPYLAERAKLALGQLAKQSPPYCNGIVLDQEGHHATCQGRSICLTPTEAKVLNYLASNPGRIVSARELLESVWQCDLGSGGTMNQVWQCISRIRRKLKREFQHLVFIRTVRGQGYMLVQHAARISHPAFPEICQELAG